MSSLAKYALVLLLPAAYLARRYYRSTSQSIAAPPSTVDEKPAKSIMQAPREDLAPPKDDPFTLAQLREFDGSDPSKPIYVSIKGNVFDVTPKAEVYGAGRSYNVFAGKDGSKGLGMSSLKEEDAIPDYSDLNEADRKVLDDWHGFFAKRCTNGVVVSTVTSGDLTYSVMRPLRLPDISIVVTWAKYTHIASLGINDRLDGRPMGPSGDFPLWPLQSR